MNTQSAPNFAARIKTICQLLPDTLQHSTVLNLIEISLREDLSPDGLVDQPSSADLTSKAILSADERVEGRIFARKAGVVAGLPLAEVVFKVVEPQVDIQLKVYDGTTVTTGQNLAIVHGLSVALFAAERTALNFLGRMSGIATLTQKYVQAVAHTGAIILDTRKTAPGHRFLDKYAVRMGGGENHRMGLYDRILIKNNHIDASGGIKAGVERVRAKHADRYPIEIEVRTHEELQTALALNPTRIMLDNMQPDAMRIAVETAGGRVPLEASGNVSLETVAEIAETGVDYISVGALTHSAPVLDVSMHVDILAVNTDQT